MATSKTLDEMDGEAASLEAMADIGWAKVFKRGEFPDAVAQEEYDGLRNCMGDKISDEAVLSLSRMCMIMRLARLRSSVVGVSRSRSTA